MWFKSMASLSRPATAAKTLWAPAGSNQQMPSFFVSTPQFRRQQHQVVAYAGDSRGAHNRATRGVAAPSIPSVPSASASLDDDHRRDDQPRLLKLDQLRKLHTASGAEIEHSADSTVAYSQSAEGVEDDLSSDHSSVASERHDSARPSIDVDWESEMKVAQASGQHIRVLEAFDALERQSSDISLEVYNVLLESLAQLALSAGDLAVLLQAYERILQRGVTPSRQTYAIVIGALAQMAHSLGERRETLALLVGDDEALLEASADVMETLSVEDHLNLAQQLLHASLSFDRANYDQSSVDALVHACARWRVPIDSALTELATPSPDLIRLASSSEQAFSAAGKLRADNKNDIALVETLGRLGDIRTAASVYADRGAPIYLQQALAEAYARNGFVGVSGRWARELASTNAGTILEASRVSDASDSTVFPSIYNLFELAAAHQQLTPRARAVALRHASAQSSVEPLLVMLRELKLKDALVDPATLVVAIEALTSRFHEPLLAVDLFAWQARKLSDQWTAHNVSSFVGQELVQTMVDALQRTDSLSLEAATVLAPFALASQRTRDAVFGILWAGRIGASEQFRDTVSPNATVALVDTHAQWVLGGSVSYEIRPQLVDMLSRLAEDVVLLNPEVDAEVATRVAEALEVVGSGPVLNMWTRKFPSSVSDINETSESSGQSGAKSSGGSSAESSMIERYARTRNGLDRAVELLERMLLLRQQPSGSALAALVDAFVAAEEPLERLHRLTGRSNDPQYLRKLAQQVAATNWPLAKTAFESLAAPDATTVSMLIRKAPCIDDVLQLLRLVKTPLPTSVANAALARLARASRSAEIGELERVTGESLLLEPETVVELVQLACRRGDVAKAEKLLSDVGTAPVAAFNSVMALYIAQSNRSAALDIFARMRQHLGPAAPTSHSYRLLMEAYLLSSPKPNLENADRVLSLMKSEGAPVSTQCWATLLRARGVLLRDFDAARNFYRGLVKNSRVLPDKRIFRALIESYVVNGHAGETSRIFREMAKYHVPLDSDLRSLAATT